MLDSFLTFINQQNWDIGNRKTLLAVSGGIDSVVMVHLFHKAGFRVGIAHCNFGLRGQDSVDDETFVRQLAEQLHIPCYVKAFSPKAFAHEQGISLQMSARSLRYDWFEALRAELNYDWIATAHHINDSIETTLLNLTRGTGLAGLHGVPATNGRVVRPLLFSCRDNIVAYAQKHALAWREDYTNARTDYKRNLIRHRVVPLLKEMNPALERTFQSSTERFRAADTLLTGFLEAWRNEHVSITDGQLEIKIKSLQQTKEPAYCLWYVLRNYGFSYHQAELISGVLDGFSGKTFYSDTHQVIKDRHLLILRELDEQEEEESLIWELAAQHVFEWGELNTQISVVVNLDGAGNPRRAFLDTDKLIFPLTIRPWAEGDVFQPFGMAGRRKKISDLLIDQKFSIFQKQRVKVLVNGNGDIIWVIGIRADERFKVTDATQRVVTMDVIFRPSAQETENFLNDF
jgi:tRNA(Ile)-lysidine synthase